MILYIYRVVGYLLLPFILIKLIRKSFLSKNYIYSVGSVFGFVEKTSVDLWVHSVSVGESKAVLILIRKLLETNPNIKILITTTTTTGFDVVEPILNKNITHTFMPVDLYFVMNRFINRINPKVILVMETEIWPNMLLSAKKRNIPIMLINARLSNKSFNGYNFFPFRKFSSKIINCFSVITAQSENDKNNYLKLGFENKVYVVGNIKFDIDLHYVSSPLNMRRHMRSSLVWLGASIRTGEHIHLLNSVLEIKDTVSSTLILVPRHLKNTPTIIKDCKKRNLSVARIDEVLNDGKFDFKKIDGLDVLIVDKMGVLIDYIKEVDIVFVGGSLVNKGCQNIIEPISCSKPVIIGYSHYNFKTIIEELIKKEAICVVENYYQLSDTLLSLHEDLNKYAELIRFSSAVFSKNQGTTNKTVEIINCEYKL